MAIIIFILSILNLILAALLPIQSEELLIDYVVAQFYINIV
jgi:hypothetical protein